MCRLKASTVWFFKIEKSVCVLCVCVCMCVCVCVCVSHACIYQLLLKWHTTVIEHVCVSASDAILIASDMMWYDINPYVQLHS